MYQHRMMLPWAHHGYDGDCAAAGDAAPRAIALPNMTSVTVAWTKCLSDMTRPSLLNNLRQHCAGARGSYERRIGHWQLKFLLKRRSVTQVTLVELKDFPWPPAPDAVMGLRDQTRALLAASLDEVLPELLAP